MTEPLNVQVGDSSPATTEAGEHPLADPTATNLAHWQELAPMHAQGKSDYYNAETLAAGRSPLQQCVESTLEFAVSDGEVNGLDVLHIQCHLGIDSVELARRGARVTGVDFSSNALSEAAAIAERCGVSIDFVQGNSMDLPSTLHGALRSRIRDYRRRRLDRALGCVDGVGGCVPAAGRNAHARRVASDVHDGWCARSVAR